MFVLYLFTGLITVYFIQSQKIFDKIFVFDFLKQMRRCDICLGYWVFLCTYPLFRITMFDGIIDKSDIRYEISLVIISSMLMTLLAHYVRTGISADHQTIVVTNK